MHKRHLSLLLILFALCTVLFGQTQAMAQKDDEVAEQPCDPKVYNQMSSRAWLETEREIMQNQNLIFKADSVLEYTCFDNFIAEAAWDGGDIFTHNKTYFGGIILPRGSATGLEYALDRVVYQPFEDYRDKNFNHWLLGGRGEFLGLGINTGTKIEPPTKKRNYTCDVMDRVWKAAKCMNFIHHAEFLDNDGFYPFEKIKGEGEIGGYKDTYKNIRQFPTSCGAGTGVKTWDSELKIAENQPEIYQFQSPLGEIFKDVYAKTLPGKCGNPAIPTGVKVVLKDGVSHLDGVCTNPGCTYKKPSGAPNKTNPKLGSCVGTAPPQPDGVGP